MITLRQVWHCPICGNVVEAVYAGQGELVCCGEPMKLLKENTVDAAKEKHVPVVTDLGNSIKVEVGSVPHPMEEKHYIAFVEVITAKKCIAMNSNPVKHLWRNSLLNTLKWSRCGSIATCTACGKLR